MSLSSERLRRYAFAVVAVAGFAATPQAASAALPGPITPIVTGYSAPEVSWNASPNGTVTGYDLSVDGSVVSHLGVETRDLVIAGLPWNSGQHTIAVQATGPDGTSPARPVPWKSPVVIPDIASSGLSTGTPAAAAVAPPTPSAPGKPTVTATTSSTVSLSWTPATVTDGSHLEYAVSGASVTGINANPGTATKTVVSGLRPDTLYTLQVVALSYPSNGAAQVSEPATVTIRTKPASSNPVAITPPTNLHVVSVRYGEVTVAWDGSTGGVGGVSRYRLFAGGTPIEASTDPTVLTTTATFTQARGTARDITVSAIDTAGNASDPSAPVTVDLPPAGTTPPATGLSASSLLKSSATLSWTPSPAVDAYSTLSIFGGPSASVPSRVSTVVAIGLNPGTAYLATQSSTALGTNTSSVTTSFRTAPSETANPVPPTAPTNVQITPTTTGATVTWTPATDDHRVVGYQVYEGSALLPEYASASGTGFYDRPADHHYDYTVVAYDDDGLTSPPVPISFTTLPTNYGYSVVGSASLQRVAKGTIPVTGALTKAAFAQDGSFTSSLDLDDTTSVKLTALGFLPVTAQLSFSSATPLAGTISGGVLSASVKLRIKLPTVTVLGVRVGGGATCQSTQLSTVALKSTGAFTPAAAATLTGSFAISNLSGCGTLTGLISPLTAGGGNALSLGLLPFSR